MPHRRCVPSLPGFKLSARLFKLWTLSTATHRGSGWVALAVSRCLALGATTSIFLAPPQARGRSVRGPASFVESQARNLASDRLGLGPRMKCDRRPGGPESLEH